MKKTLIRHGRRIGVVLLSSLFGRNWFYCLIGFINRFNGNWPVKCIFLLYPASEKYLTTLVYLWHAKRHKWDPTPVGFFKQNGRWGIVFGISATEKDFIDSSNASRLIRLVAQMENVRGKTGAEQKTFAGVLPSLFSSKGIISPDDLIERQTTIKAILMALKEVKAREGLSEETPVLILGGRGFIGSGLSEHLGGGTHYSFDAGEKGQFISITAELHGRPCIVLNLTKKGALPEYLEYFWPGVVVLNEVYPEPGKLEVAAIKDKGACCCHIAGVKGWAWPAFPRGYQGGIPCCASFLPEKEGDGSFEVIVRKM